MLIGEVCNRKVVCAARDATVRAAANLMRQHHIGDVVVVDRADPDRMPMAIVTDRDIAVEVVARGLDPETTTLADIVSWGQLVTVQETDTYAHTLDLMHNNGIRRMPVINAAGVLVGIISIDDMLPRLAHELSEVADLAERGRQREMTTRI
jgi:CBS domain-containing protein